MTLRHLYSNCMIREDCAVGARPLRDLPVAPRSTPDAINRALIHWTNPDVQRFVAETNDDYLHWDELRYWRKDATTAVLHDPYFGTASPKTSLSTFAKAWAQTGQLTALIRPRRGRVTP